MCTQHGSTSHPILTELDSAHQRVCTNYFSGQDHGILHSKRKITIRTSVSPQLLNSFSACCSVSKSTLAAVSPWLFICTLDTSKPSSSSIPPASRASVANLPRQKTNKKTKNPLVKGTLARYFVLNQSVSMTAGNLSSDSDYATYDIDLRPSDLGQKTS